MTLERARLQSAIKRLNTQYKQLIDLYGRDVANELVPNWFIKPNELPRTKSGNVSIKGLTDKQLARLLNLDKSKYITVKQIQQRIEKQYDIKFKGADIDRRADMVRNYVYNVDEFSNWLIANYDLIKEEMEERYEELQTPPEDDQGKTRRRIYEELQEFVDDVQEEMDERNLQGYRMSRSIADV